MKKTKILASPKKCLHLPLLAFVLLSLPMWGQNTEESQDSVVFQVFHALTLDEPTITEEGRAALTEMEWEALAYWDTEAPKEITELQEAVGDEYRFFGNGKFEIRLRDPNDGRKIGNIVKGQFEWQGEFVLKLIPDGGNGSPLLWNVIYLTEHYLVLDIDGLRVFFTKEKSW